MEIELNKLKNIYATINMVKHFLLFWTMVTPNSNTTFSIQNEELENCLKLDLHPYLPNSTTLKASL
jgi:hypothetical protein